ncbi:MAG TPA: helix-turn-helix transcriptional regulator [Ktedonobacteraceae bacterium]|nr:helix-turn-helix transcriptional regulator [Ktedonobacteraceae bacterium]
MTTTMMTTKHKLIALRTEVGLRTQEDFAQAAGIDQTTVSKIENGRPVSERTAWLVLHALNRARKKYGLPDITLDDIDMPLIE